MARGSVVGEAIVSQASTDEFREGYDRVFNSTACKGCGRTHVVESGPITCDCGQEILVLRARRRGRWIWDARQGRLVSAAEYTPEPIALNAPIIADRIHEGTVFDDGTVVHDIGSRQKRRAFLKSTGLEDANDASPEWRAEQVKQREREDSKNRRAAMVSAARKLYAEGKWR